MDTMENQQGNSHESALHRLAYTVGFFLGDGSLSSYPFISPKNGVEYYKNDVAFGKPDLEVIEKVRDQIADVFGKSYAIVHRKLKSGLPYFELTAHRRGIFAFFAVNTMMKSQIPALYFSASPAIKKELLTGLFDADGHVAEFIDGTRNTRRWQMGFSNTNRRLVEETASLLQQVGVKVGQISEANKAGYRTCFIIHPNMRSWGEAGFRFVSRRRQQKFDAYLAHVNASETLCTEAATAA